MQCSQRPLCFKELSKTRDRRDLSFLNQINFYFIMDNDFSTFNVSNSGPNIYGDNSYNNCYGSSNYFETQGILDYNFEKGTRACLLKSSYNY
jgi:hypothetical protein